MNIHKNARLTRQGRCLLVRRVDELGWQIRETLNLIRRLRAKMLLTVQRALAHIIAERRIRHVSVLFISE
jgi:hypothetical protein